MPELRITELEFSQIKQNLINFLRSQDEFTDYDFTGSGLSVLLDVLAYNTHYNAMLAHFVANEMFLDTAVKRSSVVSIAKTLGYIPRSVTSPTAYVNVSVSSALAGPLTIPKYTKFTSKRNNQNFTFLTTQEITASKVSGSFPFNNVKLKEGMVITQTETVTLDTVSGPFTIKNNNIDLSTLQVTVTESGPTNVFNYTSTIVDVTSNSKVFWVEENKDGYYTIIFGDGIIGQKLVAGNTVNIEYIASQGAAANGAQTFSCQNTIGGGNPITTLITGSTGGADRESIDAIRFNAPKFNATKNRAVTVEDYKSLITANFPQAKSVSVWGGENNVPPIYGRVFISIDPVADYVITQADKDNIINNVIRPRSVLTLTHEFVEPVYLYLGINASITYDSRITPFSASQIQTIVSNTIENYFDTELSTLNKNFYFGQLSNRIQTAHRAILGTLIDMHLQRRITPIQGSYENLNFYFTTAIEPNSLKSSTFTTIINSREYTAYIQDLPDATPPIRTGTGATGTLRLLDASTDEVIIGNYGTVTYDNSGLVTIPSWYVTSLGVGVVDVRFNATPQELSKDLKPATIRTTAESLGVVYPYPSENIIATLDDSTENTTNKTVAGLTVTAIPFA